MRKVLYSALAGAAMLGLAGAASAQPMQLTDAQLDSVTAGATASGLGGGFSFGTISSGVVLFIGTAVVGANAFGFGTVTSAAASFVPGPAAIAGSGLTLVLTSP